MKTKLLASLAAVFILANLAAAQGYYIRITNNTNLRASHSLKAAVSETASAGSTLHVIGAFNRWLKIDRSGDEMWMADWVAYTLVEDGGDQTQSPKIDNCCFVDRQCTTDQEWTDGYWAFQNNQCVTPAQAPAGNRHGIIIEGSAGFIDWVDTALYRLKVRSPQWYAYVTSGLNTVREVPTGEGVHALMHERAATLSTLSVFMWDDDREAGLAWLASVLVHEAVSYTHLTLPTKRIV